MRPTAQEVAVFHSRISAAIQTPLKPVLPAAPSIPEDNLAWQLTQLKVPYVRQHKIHSERRFKADFFFPQSSLVVEVQGGGWVNGHHSRGKGMENDAEKSFYIATVPARLITVTPKQVFNGLALDWILKALATR